MVRSQVEITYFNGLGLPSDLANSRAKKKGITYDKACDEIAKEIGYTQRRFTSDSREPSRQIDVTLNQDIAPVADGETHPKRLRTMEIRANNVIITTKVEQPDGKLEPQTPLVIYEREKGHILNLRLPKGTTGTYITAKIEFKKLGDDGPSDRDTPQPTPSPSLARRLVVIN